MNNNHWSIHVEFVVIFVTMLGGFYLFDAKCERQGERTDKLYEIVANFQATMAQESKDFHGRLCAIEERKKL